MKRIIIFGSLILLSVSLVRANQTRMNTLLLGDYIDDPVNIAFYPQHIILFQNNLYGDITQALEDYGIIISPMEKYGALAVWQNSGFNIGYGLNIHRFDIGLFGSPVKDRTRFGFGIGRAYFASRADISIIANNDENDKNYCVNLRLLKRKTDFILVPKYTFSNFSEPYEYINHRIGLMLQRLVLNEGFVYLVGEYSNNSGDIEDDFTKIYTGFELPLSRIVVLRLGCKETLDDDFVPQGWQIEPGLGFHIREFNLDFHLNQERLFNKDLTFVNSFGLDLDFGRF